jgi:CHAD domain-containing protein
MQPTGDKRHRQLQRALAVTWRDIRTTRKRLRRNPKSRAAVHDFRVAVRRMLAAVDLLGLHDTRIIDRTLGKMMRAFRAAGKLRDAQISAAALAALEKGHPIARRISRSLDQDTGPRARRLRRKLDAFGGRDLEEAARKTERVLANLRHRTSPPDMPALQVFATAQRDLDRHGLEILEDNDPVALHLFRVSLKRVRYMSEWLEPWLATAADKTLRRKLRAQQTTLGEIADVRAVVRAVEDWSDGKPARLAACQSLHNELLQLTQERAAAFLLKYRRDALRRKARS